MSFFSTVTTTFNNVRKGDGDGDTPEDTHIARTLRAYYTDPNLSKKYPEWPEWMPGPRPASMPTPARVTNVEARYGQVDPNSGRGYGAVQGERRNPYQPEAAAVGARPNAALSGLFDKKPRATPGAAPAAAPRTTALNSVFDRRPVSRPEPPRPQARALPSQRGNSYQNSYTADTGTADLYNYHNPTPPASGYGSRSNPASGYGSGGGGREQKAQTLASSPWSSSDASGYPESTKPTSLRSGRGLPTGGSRGYR
ncbi:hypothetical protein BJ878DRAFT_284447 [Calycina marina]|uniref:Mso1 N-terminal domain-containing protein n=1 Tax=Calycina marina TaxID=1763456 RepID=A0A9P7YV33_9HELO|nr:hypothetical protein BJ878DRAFT_284447 [Calycina marina]